MPRPKRSDAYPASMHSALNRALETGELFIPCSPAIKPNALRLHFYGLIGALRAEGRAEIGDALGFYTQADPPGLWVRLKDLASIGALVADALKTPEEIPPPAPESAADLFSRLAKGAAE